MEEGSKMATLKDYEFEVMECLRCKACLCSPPPDLYKLCPAHERFKFFAYGGGGKVAIAKAISMGTLDWSMDVADVMYKCTLCGACREACMGSLGRVQNPQEYKWTNLMELFELMRVELTQLRLTPPKVTEFLRNITKQGNPWGRSRGERGSWIKGTGIEHFKPGDEFLFYVGCIGSYDPRCQKVAKALGAIFLKGSLSFGVLGNDETCDGNEVKMLGETGWFQLLAEENISKSKELNVKKIVTLSPHAYNAMKNEYQKFGGEFEVVHYTQLLWEMIQKGNIKLSNFNEKVTYHDPCFLGRYNREYDAPREILNAVPGVELLEMGRKKELSFCCGGGSGNFYMDLLHGGENSPARIRIREAHETGADILAVSCPACLTMLEDALKTEGLERDLKVRDISEIVRESCLTSTR